MDDPDSREAGLQQLNRIVSQFYLLSEEDRADWAVVTVGQALRLLGAICGPEMIGHAYGTAEGDDRSSALRAVSDRLWLSMNLFAEVERPGSGHAIVDVAQEAYLVANGDKPKLFAPIEGKQGKRDNTHAIALWEVRALEWDACLEAAGEKPGTRHEMIAAAYGVPWDTMKKWSNKLRAHLGDDQYRYRIEVARRYGASSIPLGNLAADGARYRAAMGFSG